MARAIEILDLVPVDVRKCSHCNGKRMTRKHECPICKYKGYCCVCAGSGNQRVHEMEGLI